MSRLEHPTDFLGRFGPGVGAARVGAQGGSRESDKRHKSQHLRKITQASDVLAMTLGRALLCQTARSWEVGVEGQIVVLMDLGGDHLMDDG